MNIYGQALLVQLAWEWIAENEDVVRQMAAKLEYIADLLHKNDRIERNSHLKTNGFPVEKLVKPQFLRQNYTNCIILEVTGLFLGEIAVDFCLEKARIPLFNRPFLVSCTKFRHILKKRVFITINGNKW